MKTPLLILQVFANRPASPEEGLFTFHINGWGWVLIAMSAVVSFTVGLTLGVRRRARENEDHYMNGYAAALVIKPIPKPIPRADKPTVQLAAIPVLPRSSCTKI